MTSRVSEESQQKPMNYAAPCPRGPGGVQPQACMAVSQWGLTILARSHYWCHAENNAQAPCGVVRGWTGGSRRRSLRVYDKGTWQISHHETPKYTRKWLNKQTPLGKMLLFLTVKSFLVIIQMIPVHQEKELFYSFYILNSPCWEIWLYTDTIQPYQTFSLSKNIVSGFNSEDGG